MVFFLFHYAGNNRCNPGHCKPCLISIHAPAQGATGKGVLDFLYAAVSTHAPAQGATPRPHRTRPGRRGDFNPRSRTGSDDLSEKIDTLWAISTHAPAQGATNYLQNLMQMEIDFNPRSRTGSDADLLGIHSPSRIIFQPTLPHRERRIERQSGLLFQYSNPRPRTGSNAFCPTGKRWRSDFNPRSRTGSDLDADDMFNIFAISTHAPAQGATPVFYLSPYRPLYFNPRSRTGSDHQQNGYDNGTAISTHAPAQGATQRPHPVP